MSKINNETLTDCIDNVLKHSVEKKRKFVETVELQVVLKNYDPSKDKRFGGVVRLPLAPKEKFTVCIIGDAKDCDRAKAAGVPSMTQEDLKALKKDKKKVKKLANTYDCFLASSSLIRLIPRILGPGLNKAGKFPTSLGSGEDITEKIASQKASIKFQLKAKKALVLGVPIGNVKMSKTDILGNTNLAINFLVSLLTKNWQQVKRLYIKSSMGPCQQIFGF